MNEARERYIYTITDYAKDKGLSRQCIHKRLMDIEKEHTAIFSGKKYMDLEAYLYLEKIFAQNKVVSLKMENELLAEENKLLQQQFARQFASLSKELSSIRNELTNLTQYIKGGGNL